jgi:ABC-2 type transport system permease protein
MTDRLGNIYRLGVKELISLRRDPVFVVLIVYVFTVAVYVIANGASTDVRNASVAVVDEDRSALSQRIRDALLLPFFQRPALLSFEQIDAAMDSGQYTFVIDFPPRFQADAMAGRRPTVQVNIDATAIAQAGIGASYIQNVIAQEVRDFVQNDGELPAVSLVVRTRFNPNLDSTWFLAVMQLINNITLLAIVLAGAALIREREHGTIEHLLVMPLVPIEIMLAKVWANGLVIVVAAALSLYFVVHVALQVPVAGSIALFLAGTVGYLFAVTSLGIFLATLARNMPQFGLLAIPVVLVMNILSGGMTPLDSMPEAMQFIMQLSPSTHFIKFAQAILSRGASIDVIWPHLVSFLGIGCVFFVTALARFRRAITLVS